MFVRIHTGYLSVENGAKAPMSFYFQMANMLKISPSLGQGYGDDALEIDASDWSVVQELLEENAMLYMLPGDHGWQNGRTEEVKKILEARQ